MTRAEKYSTASLITSALIFWFFQMRMLDGWEVVEQSAGALVSLYITIVILFIISEAIIAGFYSGPGQGGEVEKDERDLLIEKTAEQNSSWFTIAAINILIIHLLANSFFEGHAFPRIDLTSMSTLFFVLFSIMILSTIIARASTLGYYIAQRVRS